MKTLQNNLPQKELCKTYAVFVTGQVSFCAKYKDIYQALTVATRAQNAGYKAKVMRVP